MTSILDVSTGTADDLHSVCLIIIAVPIISAYLESGVEMIPYMTRHNASCIITKVCVILDYDVGTLFGRYYTTKRTRQINIFNLSFLAIYAANPLHRH